MAFFMSVNTDRFVIDDSESLFYVIIQNIESAPPPPSPWILECA